MKEKIFSIYDVKAEVFNKPFFMKSKGLALRAFGDAVGDPQQAVHHHPEDYTMFYLGEWDPENGSIDILDVKVPLCSGLDFKSVEQEVPSLLKEQAE